MLHFAEENHLFVENIWCSSAFSLPLHQQIMYKHSITQMKKTMILILLSLLTLGLQAEEYTYLVFTLSDGTKKAVTASNLTIAFSGDNLIATSGSETLATLPLTSLTQMEFSNDDVTGIESVSVDQIVTDEATVVYDLNGRRMPQGAQLPKGIYILKNSNRTIKVTIR